MELCWQCHEQIHREPAWAYEHGYLVHSYDDPAKVPVELKWPGERQFEQSDEHEHEGKCEKCGLEIKSKPRKRFKGEARRTRSTISLKVPKDADEDGAAVFDELIEQARELLGEPDKPIYYILVAALYVFVRDFRAEDAE
jgi:hypothetical protein